MRQGVQAQAHRVMENIALVRSQIGLDFSRVVRARVDLSDFERNHDAMNAAYRSYFAARRLPARTCVGTSGLARGALVEIDCVVRR